MYGKHVSRYVGKDMVFYRRASKRFGVSNE